MLKRLFGGSAPRKAAASTRRRSATGEILARSREPASDGKGATRHSAQPGSDDFDPYNTGKFDRAASWERVRHSHR